VRDILGPNVTVQIAKRSERHTFKIMPKRWIVERSFAWLEKNYERWLNTSLQFINPAFLVQRQLFASHQVPAWLPSQQECLKNPYF
jgi:hypothetical protein